MERSQHRRLVIVENPASSRHGLAVPSIEYLETELRHVVRLQTQRNPNATREQIAEKVKAGDVIVLAAGDGGQNDAINGIVASGEDDLATISLPAGGENDTSQAFHGRWLIEGLAVVARLACLRDEVPTRDARLFHVEADGNDLGYGVISCALGAVAAGAMWMEETNAKAELNQAGRTLHAKIDMAVRYYFEHAKHYRMPEVRHNNGLERRLGAAILIMNDGRMAGTWHNLLAKRALFSPYFSVGHYQGLWQLPRSVWFGAQSLSGTMHGRLRTAETIGFRDGVHVPLLLDGEFRGNVQHVKFTKGKSAQTVPVADVNQLLDLELAS